MRTLVPTAVLAFLLALFADNAAAQDRPVRRDPLGTILINGATPYTLGSRRLEVLFSHRFQQPVNDGDSHNLWGLDSGADVGIGLAWGVTDRLDLSLYRASFQEDSSGGKPLVFEQAPRAVTVACARARLSGGPASRTRDAPSYSYAARKLARASTAGLTSWVRRRAPQAPSTSRSG